MRFVETAIGSVNIDHVESIRRKEIHGAELRLVSGEKTDALFTYDTLIEVLCPVVPNTTGIQSVEHVTSEDEQSVSLWIQPIVAWRITSTLPLGILPNGETAENLLFPDGRVQRPTGEEFPSTDAFLAAYQF